MLAEGSSVAAEPDADLSVEVDEQADANTRLATPSTATPTDFVPLIGNIVERECDEEMRRTGVSGPSALHWITPAHGSFGVIIKTAALGSVAGYALLQWLGRTYGSTMSERHMAMPGDEVVPAPQYNITHAITIDAVSEDVWPWLVQVGWHRAGWYTARWVDQLLFPANAASADRIIPELQHCEVGDFIPDGPPEVDCGFHVDQVEPNHHLSLRSTTHLPLRWRADLGARLTWSWTFLLVPVDGETRTRFVFRWRAVASPWWVRAFTSLAIVPADAVMSHDMLHGLKNRAEGYSSARRIRGVDW